MTFKTLTAASAAALLIAAPAIAQTTASTATELNVRATPSPIAEIMGVLDQGTEAFVEVGTGRVLRGLMKRIHRKAKCRGVND